MGGRRDRSTRVDQGRILERGRGRRLERGRGRRLGRRLAFEAPALASLCSWGVFDHHRHRHRRRRRNGGVAAFGVAALGW